MLMCPSTSPRAYSNIKTEICDRALDFHQRRASLSSPDCFVPLVGPRTFQIVPLWFAGSPVHITLFTRDSIRPVTGATTRSQD